MLASIVNLQWFEKVKSIYIDGVPIYNKNSQNTTNTHNGATAARKMKKPVKMEYLYMI